MFGDNALIILTSILVPLIVVLWITCLAICLYKHISSRFESRQQTTSVTVVVGTPSKAPTPLFTPSNATRPVTTLHTPRTDPTYAPVTSHIASSMTMADFLKGKADIGLNDSLGPKYYPKVPISTIPDPPETNQVFDSPMAPLEPPWPHLPPIDSVKSNEDSQRLSSLNSSGISRTFNNRVNFLSSQILNLQPQSRDPEVRRNSDSAVIGVRSGTSGSGRTRLERRLARFR